MIPSLLLWPFFLFLPSWGRDEDGEATVADRSGAGNGGWRAKIRALAAGAREAEARLELAAIFVRVPFPSMNANPELQAIRMTS